MEHPDRLLDLGPGAVRAASDPELGEELTQLGHDVVIFSRYRSVSFGCHSTRQRTAHRCACDAADDTHDRG
jgi:hypothetical protein